VRDLVILKRVKTWIFIFAILLVTFIFVDNLIMPSSLSWAWATLIQACIALFRQLTALTLFQFFMKRSMKLMMPSQVQSVKRLKKISYGVAITCLCTIILVFILKIIAITKAEPGDDKTDAKFLCHSFAGISVSLSWIVITLSMCLMTIKIKRIMSLVNHQLLENCQDSARHRN